MLKKINCFIYLLLITSSCINTRKVTYFTDLDDSTIESLVENLEPVIQKNDILSITVSSLNPEASQLFNAQNIPDEGANVSGRGFSISGYLVDQEGTIQFPILGKIQASGMTKTNLKDDLTKTLIDKKLLIDPIINIRYLNYRVTILGEVSRPTVVNVPSEKITLLEALGLAGDLTIFAKRENVMIIREEEGKKIIKRVNLNTAELFTSPYYYLKSNDIIYVEPNTARVASAGNARLWLPVVFSGLTVLVVSIDRLTR